MKHTSSLLCVINARKQDSKDFVKRIDSINKLQLAKKENYVDDIGLAQSHHLEYLVTKNKVAQNYKQTNHPSSVQPL